MLEKNVIEDVEAFILNNNYKYMNNKGFIDFILFLKEKEEFSDEEKWYIRIALWLLTPTQIQEVSKIWMIDRPIIKMLRDYIYYWIIPTKEEKIIESKQKLLV